MTPQEAEQFLGPDPALPAATIEAQAGRVRQAATDATQAVPPPESTDAALTPPALAPEPPRAVPQSISERLQTRRETLNPSRLEPLPAQQKLGSVTIPPDKQAEFRLRNDSDFGLKRDTATNIDYYTGVDDNSFRVGLSFVNKKEDRDRYLDNKVGKGNWGMDRFGAIYITPEGLKKGFNIESDRPRALDARRWEIGDISDHANSALPLAAAVAASAATGGLGAIPAALLVGGAGAAGENINELGALAAGYNTKTPGEQQWHTAKTFAEYAGGEVGFRALRLAGRFLDFPRVPGLSEAPDQATQQLTREAVDAGLVPTVRQYAPGRSLIARLQDTAQMVLGNDIDKINARVLRRELSNFVGNDVETKQLAGEALRSDLGLGEKMVAPARTTKINMEGELDRSVAAANQLVTGHLNALQRVIGVRGNSPEVGKEVIARIKAAKSDFMTVMKNAYAVVDKIVGDTPVVPTASLKAQAQEILDSFVDLGGGERAMLSEPAGKFLAQILKMPDRIPFAQAQGIRSTLAEHAKVNSLIAGMSERHMGQLRDATDRAFDEAAQTLGYTQRSPILGPDGKPIITQVIIPADTGKQGLDALRKADEAYRTGIKKFDAPAIDAIVRSASFGEMDPARVVQYVIKPGYSATALRVRKIIGEEAWKPVQSAHFNSMLDDSHSLIDGVDTIDGKKLYDNVKKMGHTLDAVYGKDMANDIRQLSQEFAALGGKIDAQSLKDPNIVAALQRATTAQRGLKEYLDHNALSAMAKPNFESVQAFDHVFQPNSPQRIKQARDMYQGTQVWDQFQERAMARICAGFIKPGKSPTVNLFDGAALKETLNKYGRETLEATFGKDKVDELYQFARIAEHVTQKRGAKGAGGIVAAEIGLNPLSHKGELLELWGVSRLLSKPFAVRYLSEGLKTAEKYPGSVQAAEAIARISSLAYATAHEQTGRSLVRPDSVGAGGQNTPSAPGSSSQRRIKPWGASSQQVLPMDQPQQEEVPVAP